MMHLSKQTQGLIAINIAAVIFGSAALYGKLDVSPIWIVAARAGFAALALALLGMAWKTMRALPRTLIPVLIFTGFILAMHWVTFFTSVQWAGIAVATLTFATFPFFTVIFESVRKRFWPSPAACGAGLAIIAAVAMLMNVDFSGRNIAPGAIAGLISGISFAWFGIASQKLGATLSPLLVSFYQNAVVALILIPFLGIAAQAPDEATEWLWLIVLGVITTALMHQLYFYALQRLSASTCSGFIALEPVYAIIFAAVFFNEPISLNVGVSAALIIGASFVLLREEKQPLSL